MPINKFSGKNQAVKSPGMDMAGSAAGAPSVRQPAAGSGTTPGPVPMSTTLAPTIPAQPPVKGSNVEKTDRSGGQAFAKPSAIASASVGGAPMARGHNPDNMLPPAAFHKGRGVSK
jgi:hypothetical protein